MLNEYACWCYTRIHGAFANVDTVARGTIANVFGQNEIEPARERSKHTMWSTFLEAHWKLYAASDFFRVEAWTWKGLVTGYVLFVISIADRVVHIVGITTRPHEAWMLRIARNVVDADGCCRVAGEC